MIVTYGDYTHQAGESNFQVQSRIERSPHGDPYAVRTSIRQEGALFGDNQAALISAIQGLMTAYSKDGKDYSVKFNNGTPTPDVNFISQNTIGGVRIVSPPTLSAKSQAEYSTFWNYSIELEVLTAVPGADHPKFIWAFEESLEYTGDGGPILELSRLKFGKSQPQITYPTSDCQLVQRGFLTFLNSRPSPMDVPRPLYPNNRLSDRSRIGKPASRRLNGRNVEWRVDYEYTFISNSPFPDLEPNFLP